MTLGIPLDALNAALVPLPDLLGHFWHVYGPQEYLVATGSSQLAVVLPSNVHNLALLSKLVERLFLNGVWVPDEHIGFVPARSHESIVLIPAGVDKRVSSPEQSLELALHRPNSSDVVIGRCQQTVSLVTPLYRRDEVTLVSTLRNRGLVRDRDVSQLHPRRLASIRQTCESLCTYQIGVPDVHEAVSSSSGG